MRRKPLYLVADSLWMDGAGSYANRTVLAGSSGTVAAGMWSMMRHPFLHHPVSPGVKHVI